MGLFNRRLYDHETAEAVREAQSETFRSMNDVKRAADDYLATVNRGLDQQYERAKNYNRNRPPFVGVCGCDKCGNFERHETQYKTHEYRSSTGETFVDEWLARRCNGCNYRWNEAVVTK